MSCVFCEIVKKNVPSFPVWESDTHLAFLSIFPNTDGVTVVIPKVHKPSYIFANDQETINQLMAAAKTVATKIDAAFPDVGRTGVIFEGFGVDHLHVKLYPMHGTGEMTEWQNIESKKPDVFFQRYEGYLSSHDCDKEDDDKLAKIAEHIRKA